MKGYQVGRVSTFANGKRASSSPFSDVWMLDRKEALQLAKTLNADRKSDAHWIVLALEVEDVTE